MANLKEVIYLTNEAYDTLVSTGTVTVNGVTINYDENCVYVTPDQLATTTQDGLMSASDKAVVDSLGSASAKNFTTSVTSGSSDLVTSGAVWTAIDNLPEPMVYKGTLGTGGTITSLPTASSSNEGFTYKVITAGTYASQSAKVGDVFISNGIAWTLIPSGDDVDDTWRGIKVNGTDLLGTGISTGAVNFKNGSNVTVSGSGNDVTIASSNYYPTAVSWSNGTTAGPTGTMTMSGTSNVSIPAIPDATTSRSGIVTTGAQSFGGNKRFDGSVSMNSSATVIGPLYVGEGIPISRNVGDAPKYTKFAGFDRRSGVLSGLTVFSGTGDWFFNADKKSTFTIRSTFKGNGAESDTYNANFYTLGVDDGVTLYNLFDWNLNSGWHVLPSKVSASTPAIIEVKSSSQMTYTDVLRLIITGHNGVDPSNNYSGTLTNYKIEVCTDYTNNTWVTVVERSGVEDKIGSCPMYALQTSTYTACFGIRLTITGCSVTGYGYAYIKITSLQLRDNRPDFTVPESVGAISSRGGNIYGNLIFDAKGSQQTFRPAVNNTGYLGTGSFKWASLDAVSINENGTPLSNKYQAKLSSQTAYSAKGTATKVPQITTNSLGQVTNISEVTIDADTVDGKHFTDVGMEFRGYRQLKVGAISVLKGTVTYAELIALTGVSYGSLYCASDQNKYYKRSSTNPSATGASCWIDCTSSYNEAAALPDQQASGDPYIYVKVNTHQKYWGQDVHFYVRPTYDNTSGSTKITGFARSQNNFLAEMVDYNGNKLLGIYQASSDTDIYYLKFGRYNSVYVDGPMAVINVYCNVDNNITLTYIPSSSSEYATVSGYSYFSIPSGGIKSNAMTHLLPIANNTYDLGANGRNWRDIYAQRLQLNGTNGISYAGTKATSGMITFYDNTVDANGNGIGIGGGGVTIVGSGESTSAVWSGIGSAAGSEYTYVASDNDVYVVTNMQNGWANRKTFDFSADGSFNATTLKEGGTSLADKYLGKTAKASDAEKLDGQDSTYYLNYNNLTNKPTIPTVNDGTLTIQKNGTQVATFTANQSGNATANITVPTKVSELTNDSGYTTNTGTVTSIKVGSTSYDPSSGVVSLPAYPTVNNGDRKSVV